MKLNVLISLLFIIATTFTALHELEHISGEHNSASCQICAVDDHLVSGDIVVDIDEVFIYSFDTITTPTPLLFAHFKKVTNHSTAPPSII